MSSTSSNESPASGLYRIGTVSRLAGIPVSTLRVWEQRYGAFTPAKTQGSHRLYEEADLVRARLLRRLTEEGHGISAIASLPADKLQAMLSHTMSSTAPPREPAAAPSAVVLGSPVAVRLMNPAWTHRWQGSALQVRHVVLDLDEMEQLAASREPGAGPAADLALVRLNTMHPDVPGRLARACQQLGIHRAIVLYCFAAEATVDALRAQGMLARREPVTDAELAQLIDATLLVDPSVGASAVIPARRFPDETLLRVARAQTTVLCECPRHIADLLAQLSAFEEYSGQCLHRDEADAQLHAYLRSVSGSARAMFEQALERVATHAGISLD